MDTGSDSTVASPASSGSVALANDEGLNPAVVESADDASASSDADIATGLFQDSAAPSVLVSIANTSTSGFTGCVVEAVVYMLIN